MEDFAVERHPPGKRDDVGSNPTGGTSALAPYGPVRSMPEPYTLTAPGSTPGRSIVRTPSYRMVRAPSRSSTAFSRRLECLFPNPRNWLCGVRFRRRLDGLFFIGGHRNLHGFCPSVFGVFWRSCHAVNIPMKICLYRAVS